MSLSKKIQREERFLRTYLRTFRRAKKVAAKEDRWDGEKNRKRKEKLSIRYQYD